MKLQKVPPFQAGMCTQERVGAVEDFHVVFRNDFEAKRLQRTRWRSDPPSHREIFKDSGGIPTVGGCVREEREEEVPCAPFSSVRTAPIHPASH